jgi:hypothetical protein
MEMDRMATLAERITNNTLNILMKQKMITGEQKCTIEGYVKEQIQYIIDSWMVHHGVTTIEEKK